MSSGTVLMLAACSMSSMSWPAAVQTQRAVGERSLSGRGARAGWPLAGRWSGGAGEGPAGAVGERRGGVVDGDRRRPTAAGAGGELSGVVVADRALAEHGARLRAGSEDV